MSEAVRLLQEVERPVLVVCGEKFSDKIATARTSRMIFGDAAPALVIGPAAAGAPPDIEVLQTYASGPMSEVDSIVWPNPEFDNNINIERVGNNSSASIPLAIHDAVREGVIDRPMRIFAPGFGAGAVGGYVVMRVDPAVVG